MERNKFLKLSGLAICAGASMPLFGISNASQQPNSGLSVPRVVKSKEGKRVNVLGDNMLFKLTGADTNGQYVLIEQNNEPGVGIPMHTHENEDEIFRVVEGQIELVVDNQKSLLGPGDLGFCPRGIPHTWKVTGSTPAKVDLSFFPAGMEDMFEELSQLPPGPPDMEKLAEVTGRYGVKFV